MNKIEISGRLTRDPESRGGAQGVVKFTLAVKRRFAGKNGSTDTDFIPCTAFGQNGTFVEKYARKGSRLEVAGRLQVNSYTDRDGQSRVSFEVIVEDCEFGESRRDTETQTAPAPAPALAPAQPYTPPQKPGIFLDDDDEEELPGGFAESAVDAMAPEQLLQKEIEATGSHDAQQALRDMQRVTIDDDDEELPYI